MKKILLFLLLLIPCLVMAETCGEGVSIKSIEIESKTESVVEIKEASVKGTTINLDLSLSEVKDNIKYKMVIQNDSNTDYVIDADSVATDSEYISFDLESETKLVKAKSSEIVYLTVEYKNLVPVQQLVNGVFNEEETIKLSLSAQGESVNPNTGMAISITVIAIVLIISLVLIIVTRKKYLSALPIVIGLMIIIPYSIKALCKIELVVQSNIKIENKNLFCVYSNGNINYYHYDKGDTFAEYLEKNEYMYDVLNLIKGYEYSRGVCETNTIVFGTIEEVQSVDFVNIYYEDATTTIFPENKIQNHEAGCYLTGHAGLCQ